eukprot:TRINITY_DN84034_c0_g1_i1.p1 TRINITY_DN84034_c0_g1~~TRINITY_DN84034_c0_g1_i1.p1  ORF type:complete len:273 (-),score=46.53 TRINITY_DN84034_c0_g1_i1:136-900(-)
MDWDGERVVTVGQLDGTAVQLELPQKSIISTLKEQIASALSIPVRFQQLLCNDDVIDDHQEANLDYYVLVVTVEDVMRKLSNATRQPGEDTVRARQRICSGLLQLSELGPRGGEDSRETVRAYTKHRDHAIRYAAISALGQMAERGCRSTIDLLMCFLGDMCCTCLAVQALRAVADEGNDHVIEAISRLLEGLTDDGGSQKSRRLKLEAIDTLQELSPQGHKSCVRALRRASEDEDALVRATAAQALESQQLCA